MAETLKTIASSTAKLRELLVESKKDLHQIQLMLDALDDGLKSLWPFEQSLISQNGTAPRSNGLDFSADSLKHPYEDDSIFVAPQLLANASLWKESVNLVASSRIVGVAAQADDSLARAQSRDESVRRRTWFGDGKIYSRWIGRGAVWLIDHAQHNLEQNGKKDTVDQGIAQMFGKAMGIGYQDELIEQVTCLMVLDNPTSLTRYIRLIASLKSWEQEHFLTSLLRYLGKLLDSAPSEVSSSGHRTAVSAVAAFLHSISKGVPAVQPQLAQVLTSSPQSELLARACIAALPFSARLEVLEQVWAQFSDTLQIRHTPILSQEANARVVLITAGCVYREDSKKVVSLARKSSHNIGVSERLKNSSDKIRWLGMCVGMAISKLVDTEGSQLNFPIDDLDTPEARKLRAFTTVNDELGDLNDLRKLFGSTPSRKERTTPSNVGSKPKPSQPTSLPLRGAKPGKIIEVLDESDVEEDDDLVPYAKPDADEPDSDEDATLVNRNKPKAPVYIRDLISWLSDTEDRERHILALQTAGPLIRRKATFGSELHDRVAELVSCLVSLQDHFGLENFHELKQAALIALVIAEPKAVGPLMIKTLFEGDFSVSQRVAIIVAIGVGGRELAGFKDEAPQSSSQSNGPEQNSKAGQQDWPSQRLPGKLHELYSDNQNIQSLLARRDIVQGSLQSQQELDGSQRINALTRRMESTMLNPVSTRVWSKPRPRTRLLKNDLTSIIADYFFYPLTRYWQAFSQSSVRARNPINEPTLSALALKTLTLLLLGAGPSAPSLPSTTKELLTLLLSLRSKAIRHQPIMEGVLFALVAILDLQGVGAGGAPDATIGIAGGARWLAEECGKEIVEFREWVGGVWESIENRGNFTLSLEDKGDKGGGRSDEETNRCRVLAAKVLVGINEIVEKYQRLLVGELSRVS